MRDIGWMGTYENWDDAKIKKYLNMVDTKGNET